MRLDDRPEAEMLSRTARHALRAIVALAELPQGRYAAAAAIAQQIGAPQNYLGKLLKTLAREGLVDSQRGLGGGFRLARDPSELSLLEIVDPIEHLNRWSECILGSEECSQEAPCPLHERFKTVRDAYLQLLGETTLADLLAKRSGVVVDAP